MAIDFFTKNVKVIGLLLTRGSVFFKVVLSRLRVMRFDHFQNRVFALIQSGFIEFGHFTDQFVNFWNVRSNGVELLGGITEGLVGGLFTFALGLVLWIEKVAAKSFRHLHHGELLARHEAGHLDRSFEIVVLLVGRTINEC